MLKLKYLFDNKDLATMIVSYWMTITEVTPLFQYYRISANAIYPFKKDEQVYYLRFVPKEEKLENQILAELEFLKYLANHHYSVVEPVLSKEGNLLEEVQTPWGVYYAVVFKRVLGQQLSDLKLSEEIVFGYGKSLGQLHKLSQNYLPSVKRINYKQQLEWMKNILNQFPNQDDAKVEINLLEKVLTDLPITDYNYGLIHYDFDPDNLFYVQETGVFTPIDFDDSLYHWYVMDIECALDSVKQVVSEKQYNKFKEILIKGYKTEMLLEESMLLLMPIFTRYANLYRYVRLLRSSYETWKYEPGWMINLRNKMKQIMKDSMRQFGKPFNI